MQKLHPQYMSPKQLKGPANLQTGLLSKTNINASGATPSSVNKIIPGNKKLENGECSNMESGIPKMLPEGEMISTKPPKIAPTPRKESKNTRT